MATTQQITAIRALADALVETVKETGDRGAPSGPMYAALCGMMTVHQYRQVMDRLVTLGRLRQEGHVYYYVRSI